MRHPYLALLLALTMLLPYAASADDTGTEICLDRFLSSADSTGKPAILYTGRTKINIKMRSGPSLESESLGALNQNARVSIFGYDQTWLFCWDDSVGIYYIGRHNVDSIEPVAGNTEPYGVIRNSFVAVTAVNTSLRKAPDADAEVIAEYPADTRISFWLIQDGWAVVPYKRIVAYLYVGDLKELTPVSPTVEYAQEGEIISAFTTFYSTKQTDLNLGRMENMRVGCQYIDQTYEPGFVFDFNGVAGPYRYNRGYKDAPVLIDGETVPGSGGGTCQISTTLYNVLLQLPKGITILYRHAHGPGGASYAPHGVDAAVGRNGGSGVIELDLKFQNDFPFPITIDSTVQNGALCICIRKGA